MSLTVTPSTTLLVTKIQGRSSQVNIGVQLLFLSNAHKYSTGFSNTVDS